MSSQSIAISSSGYNRTYIGSDQWVTNAQEIYAGYGLFNGDYTTFACMISFTIDSSLVNAINSISEFTIPLVTMQTSNPGYTTAYLTQKYLNPMQCACTTGISNSTYIEDSLSGQSYYKSTAYDANGNALAQNADQASRTTIKYIFKNIALTAGTYYLYIVRGLGKDNYLTYHGFCAFSNPKNVSGVPSIDIDYIAKYTVKYNAGSGSGAPANQTKIEGTNLTLSRTKPTKSNTSSSSNFDITGNANGGSPDSKITATKTTVYVYSFSHWSGSDGKTYKAGDTYTGNAPLTLTAVYNSTSSDSYVNNKLSGLVKPARSKSINSIYTASFNANGGTCDTDNISTKKWDNYSFYKWNDNELGSGADYDDNSSFTSAKTVYAKWNITNTTDQIVLPTPTRNGYDFMGWSTNPDATSGYEAGSSITLVESTVYYAIWKAKGLVRITVDGTKKEALAYVHHNSSWRQVVPCVHSNSKWHISG